MAQTFVQYAGDGITTTFSVTFQYIAKANVGVTVDGVPVPFSWVNAQVIKTVSAPPAGSVLKVFRTTLSASPVVDFVDGSTLTESALDLSAQQARYLAQEAKDVADAAVGPDVSGSAFDLRARRAVNVAEPVLPSDAANKAWTEAQNAKLMDEMNAAVVGLAEQTTFIFVEKEATASSTPEEGAQSSADYDAQLAAKANRSGDTFTGPVFAPLAATTANDISVRVPGGFYQTDQATKAHGWPVDSFNWQHLIASTHSNEGNYYSLQFAGGFFDNDHFYARKTRNAGTTPWRELWHDGNLNPDHGKYLPLRRLGFKGDGAYHGLSETFATLAEAQVVFPRARSLDEQIDGHAVQKLIDIGVSSPAHGAVIEIPPGQWYLSRKLEVAGNAHLTLNGSGIKATTCVMLADDLFLLAGYQNPLQGTLEINDMRIAAAGGTSGFRAMNIDSAAVPSMLGRNVQFDGWQSVMLGNNITGSHLTKWRAYNPHGIEEESKRTQAAYIFRQTRGCFLNVFEAFQTEGFLATCDYLNTSNPGYEGQYWKDLNTNSGTSVANIVSTVQFYDSPQWYFTGVELEVSGNWFNLVNVSGVTIEVDFALTYQGSSGFACFSLTGVAGAELVINQFKSYSYPAWLFYLNSGNAAINMRVGALRVEGGKVGGLVYFGTSCRGCREYGITGVFGWDYSISFASGPTMRTDSNISVHDVKYRANVSGFHATVEVRGPTNSVSLSGTLAGNTGANGDMTTALPDKVFAVSPIVLVTNGDANTPMETTGVVSATPTALTVRCQGAGAGVARRINFIGYGS